MDHRENSSSTGKEFKAFISAFLRERRGGSGAFDLRAIPADGSSRSFWRIFVRSTDRTFIAMANEPADDLSRRENFAYLMINRHLHEKGLPLPRIHSSHMEKGWFIMDDFGTVSLQDAASTRDDRVALYERVVEVLFRLQLEGAKGFNPSWTWQTEKYDAFVMRRYESDYFRESFLCNYLGLKKEWPELESPFNYLAEKASRAESRFFLHRDFQSRNIMVMGDRIGVLDWQGGRSGPLGYDLASLLIDPYTRLSQEEKEKIYQKYVGLMRDALPEMVESMNTHFPYLAVQRNLQILGAFSFLSRVRKKTHFETYVAPALVTLRELLVKLKDEGLSPLMSLVLSLK